MRRDPFAAKKSDIHKIAEVINEDHDIRAQDDLPDAFEDKPDKRERAPRELSVTSN